jgi:hypothetical protein
VRLALISQRFHFSARYRDRAEELTREAEEAFFNRASGNV